MATAAIGREWRRDGRASRSKHIQDLDSEIEIGSGEGEVEQKSRRPRLREGGDQKWRAYFVSVPVAGGRRFSRSRPSSFRVDCCSENKQNNSTWSGNNNSIGIATQLEANMHSSSSCGGGCIQYDIEVSCPSCGTVADIKLSKSCDNPGRLFYKCDDCGKFMKWAKPVEGRGRIEEEELSRDGRVNELKDITTILKDVNGRILLCIIVMVAIL